VTLADERRTRPPVLLIQPIVENAVSHGIEPKLGKGHLSVTVRKVSEADGPSLLIRVKDNGAGMEPERLAAVRARLDRPFPPRKRRPAASACGTCSSGSGCSTATIAVWRSTAFPVRGRP